jgi:hypothetical protein
MTKETAARIADGICRALLAIVALLRHEFDLPSYRGITIEIKDSPYSEPPVTDAVE